MFKKTIIPLLIVLAIMIPLTLAYANNTEFTSNWYGGKLKGVYISKDYSNGEHYKEMINEYVKIYVEVDREAKEVYLQIYGIGSLTLPYKYIRENSRVVIIHIDYSYETTSGGPIFPPPSPPFPPREIEAYSTSEVTSNTHDYYRYVVTIILYGHNFNRCKVEFNINHVSIDLTTHAKTIEEFRAVFRGLETSPPVVPL